MRTMISAGNRSHRRSLLSRFTPFERDNIRIQARPIGPRHLWLFRWLPYRTGDDIRLKVKVRVREQPVVGAFLLEAFRIGASGNEVPSNLDALRYQLETNSEREYNARFRTIPYSGEYVIDVAYAYPATRALPMGHTQRMGRLGAIQAVQDYKPMMALVVFIFTVIGGAVGVGLNQLIVWLAMVIADP